MLRIIIEYSSLKDFALSKLGEMIHPNLVVKIFTFIFWHFVFSATSSNVHPNPSDKTQVTLSPIHNPQNLIWNYFFQTWLWHPSYSKIHVILSKCDNVIENIQIHMSWWVSFFFLGLKFCINAKNEYEKGIFWFFLLEKKSHYICKKMKIMLQHSPIGFGLVTIFSMFR